MRGDPDSTDDPTTLHVRRAAEGDEASTAWVVKRLTPFLLAQARYRLARHLHDYEPEDLVNDVWLVALPRLADVRLRDGRKTPSLVRFLGAILLNRYHKLMRQAIAGRSVALETPDSDSVAGGVLAAIGHDAGGGERKIVGQEVAIEIVGALAELTEREREVLILRGFEGASPSRIAEAVGIDVRHVAVIFHRAKTKLRDRLSAETSHVLELLDGAP